MNLDWGARCRSLCPRTLSGVLQRLAGPYPVVYLTGPRQWGKTTLARAAFPDYTYVSLEDLQRRTAVQEDPRGFLRGVAGDAGVIIDEAQRVPELFSYLQQIVDERRARPLILTGSQQFLLAERVAQSLAGRAAVLQLLPFSVAELWRRPALTPDAPGRRPLSAPARSWERVLPPRHSTMCCSPACIRPSTIAASSRRSGWTPT